MRRNNRDYLPSLTFILKIPIFWEVYLEPIRKSMRELFGKIALSWLLLSQ